MSSSAFASALKGLGGVHKTRNPVSQGGSGSAHHEDGAESAAPKGVPDLVVVLDSGAMEEVA